LLDRIVTQSDGVPLFIEELTRAVLETPELNALGATLTIPDTLQASLMARLDRLPGSKTVAQVASVIGREFAHALLATAADMKEADLVNGLQQLTASGLLFRRGVPPDVVYAFKHSLVRDVVYASLPKPPRQMLHRRIAEAIRDELPERAEAEPGVIAYHFTEAGLKESAVPWWSKAGNLALQRSAYTEAISHLERALELSKEIYDSEEQRVSRLRLQISVGNALRVTRGFAAPETQAAFARARDIAATIAEAPERFSAEYGLWSGSFQSGELSAMRELADAFMRKVQGRHELPESGVAHRISGMTDWFAGNFVSAKTHLELALAAYDDVRDRPLAYRFGQDLAVPVLAYLAMTLWPLGMCDEASRFIEETIAKASRTEHVPTIAYAYLHAAFFEMLRHDHVRCGSYVQAYLNLAREHAMSLWLANGAFHSGWVRWQAGDHEGGRAQMHEGLRLLRGQGQTLYLPLMGVRLAETEADDVRYDAAIATVDAELARIGQSGQRWYLAEAYRVHGEIIRKSCSSDFEPAERAFAKAIEVARSQSAKLFEDRAAQSLARP
jgi:predicted ATPase